MSLHRLTLLVLVGCASMSPKPAAIQTDEEKLHGINHLVFTNDWGRPLCSVFVSQHFASVPAAVELVQTQGGTGPRGRVPIEPGAQVTFDITNGTYDFSSYSCDQMTRGSAQAVSVKGPMTISIGGTPHARAGYASTTVAMSGHLDSPPETTATPTCSPDFASEVDPAKCCSGQIDTHDKGSHYFCKPRR